MNNYLISWWMVDLGDIQCLRGGFNYFYRLNDIFRGTRVAHQFSDKEK
jgi:hypothetical protein